MACRGFGHGQGPGLDEEVRCDRKFLSLPHTEAESKTVVHCCCSGRSMQAWTPAVEDAAVCGDDAADEIMERIVRSATQGPGTRAQPRERRRSRANRKSCMCVVC